MNSSRPVPPSYCPARFATILAVLLLMGGTAPFLAASTYQDLLRAGDASRGEKRYDKAVADYEEAAAVAATPTERALALAKKGVVLVDQENYAAARQAAEQALAIDDLKPVALVTARLVLAQCQMKDEKDFNAAAATLDDALALEDIDWLRPTLTMMLGDCYRFDGMPAEALEVYGRIPELADVSEPVKAIAFLNIGITRQYLLQDDVAAKEAYGKAVELNPSLKTEVEAHMSRLP